MADRALALPFRVFAAAVATDKSRFSFCFGQRATPYLGKLSKCALLREVIVNVWREIFEFSEIASKFHTDFAYWSVALLTYYDLSDT